MAAGLSAFFFVWFCFVFADRILCGGIRANDKRATAQIYLSNTPQMWTLWKHIETEITVERKPWEI